MATTDFGALSTARKRAWAMETVIAGRDQSFWMSNGFVGSDTADMTKPIQRITELTKLEGGLYAVIQLVADMRGDGVVGDNQLSNNEEALINDSQTIQLDQLRNGVKSKGRLSEQSTVITFRKQAKSKLSFWVADKMDELCFLTVAGRAYTLTPQGATRGVSQLPSLSYAADVVAPSTNRVMYAGVATSTATLAATDKMSWDLLVRASALAQRKQIKPIMARGKPYYAVVLSTEQLRDLKRDGQYQTITSKAGPRGDNNPLFNNAVADVDGLVIYAHQKTASTLQTTSGSKYGAGGTIDGAEATLMGVQALGLATIGDPVWEEADQNDYKNQPGIGVGRIFGLLKPQFKYPNQFENTREDFGVLSIFTAASAT